MNEISFEVRLAFVHECGHALMMYLLFPDQLFTDSIIANPGEKPAFNPSNEFLPFLGNLTPEEACGKFALVAVAGGTLELLVMNEALRENYHIKLILGNELPSKYKSRKDRFLEIKKAMDSDIKRYTNYYSQHNITTPELCELIKEASLIILPYLTNNDNADNIMSISDTLTQDFELNYRYRVNKATILSGKEIVAYFKGLC